jgi:hypothetical protein
MESNSALAGARTAARNWRFRAGPADRDWPARRASSSLNQANRLVSIVCLCLSHAWSAGLHGRVQPSGPSKVVTHEW